MSAVRFGNFNSPPFPPFGEQHGENQQAEEQSDEAEGEQAANTPRKTTMRGMSAALLMSRGSRILSVGLTMSTPQAGARSGRCEETPSGPQIATVPTKGISAVRVVSTPSSTGGPAPMNAQPTPAMPRPVRAHGLRAH